MRTVWATIFATWALFAVLAVLAWTRPQPATSRRPSRGRRRQGQERHRASIVVVKGSASTSHATTRTSPVGAG